MNKKRVQIWVDPAFKRLLKSEAAIKGTTIADLTKKAATLENPLDCISKDEKKKKWNFRI